MNEWTVFGIIAFITAAVQLCLLIYCVASSGWGAASVFVMGNFVGWMVWLLWCIFKSATEG